MMHGVFSICLVYLWHPLKHTKPAHSTHCSVYCSMALKIFYPLKSIQLFNSDHSREIFIAEVVIIFFITTAPSVVSIGMSNIGIVTFPPIQCGNSDRTYYFYTAVFPIMIVTCISGVLMILTLHKLHMVSNYTLAK